MKNKVTCSECQNDIEIPESTQTGDVIECQKCGAMYRYMGENNPLELIQEEK